MKLMWSDSYSSSDSDSDIHDCKYNRNHIHNYSHNYSHSTSTSHFICLFTIHRYLYHITRIATNPGHPRQHSVPLRLEAFEAVCFIPAWRFKKRGGHDRGAWAHVWD